MCGPLDLEIHWFITRGARVDCQAFECVLRLQTDITILLNTSVMKVSKPIVEVSSCHCCLNINAFIPEHQQFNYHR